MAEKTKDEEITENVTTSFDISLNDSEEELIRKTDGWIEDAESFMSSKIKHWEDNDRWFDGKQWDNEKQEYQSDTVINRIFPSIRNMVGLATDSRPKADLLPAPAADLEQAGLNKEKAKRLSLLFDQRWDELQMSSLTTKALFQAFIYDDAFLMPFWNYQENDLDVEIINPKKLKVDPTATSVDDAQYLIVEATKNRKWIETNYPDKAKKVKYGASKSNQDSNSTKDQVDVHFVLTDEIRIVRAGKVLLEKSPNPYYEFRDDETQRAEWEKEELDMEAFVPIRNYFRRPQKPIIPIPTYNVGEFFSRSIMNQLKPVQRTIDKRKQQIDENANTTANPQWVYDSDQLEEDKANLITNEPGLLIGISGGPAVIRKEPGADMPNYVMTDLAHSESTFDNIMGHHDISRGGQDKTQTATEAGILREADQTPVRLLVRNYEQSVLKLYQWWLQMVALFYTEEHYARVWGDKGVVDFVAINRNDVSDGINIVVRPGSTLPTDKKTMRADAVQLAQIGLLDPLTLYEVLELPDPQKTANRLVNWKVNQTLSDKPVAPPQTSNSNIPGTPGPTGQMSPDVQWAKAEEERISQGDMPQIRPDMVTEAHIGEHQVTLDSGEFPEPNLLEQMIRAEIEVLQQGGQQGATPPPPVQ